MKEMGILEYIKQPFGGSFWDKKNREIQKENEYSEEELLKWKKGAEEFKAFEDSGLSNKLKRYIGKQGAKEWSNVKADLQVLFLRERPACLIDTGPYANRFELYGIHSAGQYLYHPDMVEQTIKKYEDKFRNVFDSLDASTVMNGMVYFDSQPGNKNNTDLVFIRGILLGFPSQAVQDFCDRIKTIGAEDGEFIQKIHGLITSDPRGDVKFSELYFDARSTGNSDAFVAYLLDYLLSNKDQFGLGNDFDVESLSNKIRLHYFSSDFNVHGFHWSDSIPPSAESEALKKRLGDAFEMSGILER